MLNNEVKGAPTLAVLSRVGVPGRAAAEEVGIAGVGTAILDAGEELDGNVDSAEKNDDWVGRLVAGAVAARELSCEENA